MILPSTPEHSCPRAGQDTGGVRVIGTTLSRPAIDRCCPRRGTPGVVGEGGQCQTEPSVAGPARMDSARLTRLVGDRRDAGLRSELLLARIAAAILTELGEDFRCVDASGPRKRHHELTVGQRRDGALEASREGMQLLDERAPECWSVHQPALPWPPSRDPLLEVALPIAADREAAQGFGGRNTSAAPETWPGV